MYMIYVDTEDYSGNFERELVAFATGCSHEYDHGGIEKIANTARSQMTFGDWWRYHIEEHSGDDEDDPPCYANIAPTPGWFNNGMGGHFKIGDPGVDVGGHHYPAYQSVSIAVDELPPADVWNEFQERVIEFCERFYVENPPAYNPHRTPITLTGVRQEEVVVETKVTRRQIM